MHKRHSATALPATWPPTPFRSLTEPLPRGRACSPQASRSQNFQERDKLVTNTCSLNGNDKMQAIVKKTLTISVCFEESRRLWRAALTIWKNSTLHSWGSFSSTVWFCLHIPASTGTPAAFSPFPPSVSLGQKAAHRRLCELQDDAD